MTFWGATEKMLKRFKWDFLNLGLITLLSPLYFYKLAQSSLGSWDEAWYGDIARNILQSGNLFILSWNGAGYFDHPPAGFWIIAVFESIFGFNTFGVRVGSAVFGLLGLYLIYLLGKELFSRTVGLVCALALSSSYWYLFRARSGDLDIFLTVFFVLTFYLTVKSSKNVKFLIPLAISLGLLFLTKTLIPFTIIPALVIIFFGKRINFKILIKPALVFLLITLPWIVAQFLYSPIVFIRYLQIGTPGVGEKTDYLSNFKLMKEYLHNGIGKWFWPGVLGVLIGPLTLNKGLIALSVFCLTFFIPFSLSNKGHIWHLIPLYPFLILSFFGFAETGSKILAKKFFSNHQKNLAILTSVGMVLISIYFAQMQIKRAWYEFIDTSAYISDEEILSKKAGQLPYDFFIDGADFRPTAVFYSGKNVTLLADKSLLPLFESGKKFTLITNPDRLKLYQINESKYQLIAKDRDKILILRK